MKSFFVLSTCTQNVMIIMLSGQSNMVSLRQKIYLHQVFRYMYILWQKLQDILSKAWNDYEGQVCAGISWDRFTSVEQAKVSGWFWEVSHVKLLLLPFIRIFLLLNLLLGVGWSHMWMGIPSSWTNVTSGPGHKCLTINIVKIHNNLWFFFL